MNLAFDKPYQTAWDSQPYSVSDTVSATTITTAEPDDPQPLPEVIKQLQRQQWAKLHTYASDKSATWNEAETKKFYADWNNEIPHLGCGCGSHWARLAKDNPPDFSTAEAFLRWSHARHNEVSNRLTSEGRPHVSITWNECCELYGYPNEWKDSCGSVQGSGAPTPI
jgi:hypothetical protein